MTAALLFSQYSIRPRYSGLFIAGGYLFSGLFAFAQTLAFPGAYSTPGLIGNRDTAGWLFVLWHTAYPMAVLAYALSKDRNEIRTKVHESPATAIIVAMATVIMATATGTFVVASFPNVLPSLYQNDTKQTALANAVDIYLSLLNVVTLAVLFQRRRTILDLWLMVTLIAWLPNFLTSAAFTFVRFSIGWYISRGFSVVASSTLLVVLLAETTMLYARLASSILLLRRERTDRLTTVEAATAAIAHEVRQPLAGITTLGAAGLRWLNRTPAEVEKAKSCLSAILGAAQRSEDIIASIRGLFKKTPSHRVLLQLNDLSRLVMQLARHDLLSSGITVTGDYQEDLPPIYGDHTQLQQVMLNLVKNAIDAMSSRPLGERRLRVATGSDGHSAVSFYIRDSGLGVAAEDRDRIFSPFFTTKSDGMGLGLSICRTIVEEHGGTLQLTKSGPAGSTFEMVLPIAPPQRQADDTQAAPAEDHGARPDAAG
jgi:signal transduction histidine kinase